MATRGRITARKGGATAGLRKAGQRKAPMSRQQRGGNTRAMRRELYTQLRKDGQRSEAANRPRGASLFRRPRTKQVGVELKGRGGS